MSVPRWYPKRRNKSPRMVRDSAAIGLFVFVIAGMLIASAILIAIYGIPGN
jgi:hypothetical protein